MMTEGQIEKLREQYPIPFEELCIYNSFAQILGKEPEDIEPSERKRRWFKMMSFDKKMKKYWTDTQACHGCLHLNETEAWCELQGLPCTVNPLFTYSRGMIGMACCGAGRIDKEPTLFEEIDYGSNN